MSVTQRQALIIPGHEDFSIRKQCELLSLNRSSLYYMRQPENPYNLELMRLLDKEHTKHPFKGVIKMVKYLQDLGHEVNHKRVRRLLRLMGLVALYPKPKLSVDNKEHKVYPYLLKGLKINAPNQVWSTDITYIRLAYGYVYLTAVIDWYSRYVLSWRLSNSLDASFCIEALEDALLLGTPEIFNTDQGAQFTCNGFIQVLAGKNIKISMDGRGRALDNIFVERLWRTVKYEEIYLHEYQSVIELKQALKRYFLFYNLERHHQALDYKKPVEIHYGNKR
jgi:putative transposase